MNSFLTLASLLLVLTATDAQPTGTNPGLPPSASATGLAPQKIQSLAVTAIQTQHNWTSRDLLAFLTNTECLEAQFDSYAAFGVNMDPDLTAGGPEPIGGMKANLSADIQAYVEEVARDEVGHVRIIREAIGSDAPPCPEVNFTAFEPFMNMAFGTEGVPFNPFANDTNFVLSMFALEEVSVCRQRCLLVHGPFLPIRFYSTCHHCTQSLHSQKLIFHHIRTLYLTKSPHHPTDCLVVPTIIRIHFPFSRWVPLVIKVSPFSTPTIIVTILEN